MLNPIEAVNKYTYFVSFIAIIAPRGIILYLSDMERLNRIKAVLADRQMLQTELAEKIGRNRNTITRICNNKSQPSLEDLYRIADVLKVDVCELLIRSNERGS